MQLVQSRPAKVCIIVELRYGCYVSILLLSGACMEAFACVCACVCTFVCSRFDGRLVDTACNAGLAKLLTALVADTVSRDCPQMRHGELTGCHDSAAAPVQKGG